jgi:MYXO-CTERM domain-containing protein
MTGEIALTGAPNGPVVVALETIDVPDPPEPDAGTDAADDAVGDAGPDAGDPAERTPDGGCDCAAPGGGRSGGLGALFLLGLLVFRRSTRLKAQARRGPTPSAVHHPS